MRLPGTAASLSSRMSSMSLSSGIASVGTNTGMLAKECSSQTNARGATASYRAVGLGMHQSQPLLTAIAPDLDPMVHGPKPLTARYASSFGYENSGAFCPVILHMRLITFQFSWYLSFSFTCSHNRNLQCTTHSSFHRRCPHLHMPWVVSVRAPLSLRTAHHLRRHVLAQDLLPCPMAPFSYACAKVSGEYLVYLILMAFHSSPLDCSIDMTLDKAVRVLNQRSMVAVSLSRNGTNSALIHPNGRILQSGSKVEIVTYDGMKNNNFVWVQSTGNLVIYIILINYIYILHSRYAKMWYKGVSFTSESCALIYLVDTAGTRTTTDTFTDLTKDYTLAVFYEWVSDSCPTVHPSIPYGGLFKCKM